MNLIEREFSDTLQILSDFIEKPKYLIAFSGGVDSLVLLNLCIQAVGKQNVVAVYVNHNLRSDNELNKEIELNRNNCKKLGVQLVVRTIEKGLIEQRSKNIGIEAAARKVRYELLEEERQKNNCNYVLTAHHKDDQIETVLMRIIKGSPVTGLRGISEKWGKVLRPLLEFSKKEIVAYAEEKGLEFSTDSTNSDNKYLRNEIRNEILPELRKIMPDCDNRILAIRNAACSSCGEVEEVYDQVSIDKFLKYNKVQQIMVLFEMWDNIVGTSLPQTLQTRVIENLSKKSIVKESSNGGTFYSYNGTLFLVNNEENEELKDYSIKFEQECEKYVLPNGLIVEKTDSGSGTDLVVDFAKFTGTPVLRFAKEGESIKLKDGSKTIGKLLQDMKVPEVFRLRVPVVADDEGLCIVFATPYGGKNRICAKLRSPLALNKQCKYICYKGNNTHEEKR